MNNDFQPYRTIFVGELKQLTGLSTGGRDGELHADAVVARDGAGRPILRGAGLAGALLATLDEFDLTIPAEISARLPRNPDSVQKYESLWLMHHAHLAGETAQTLVRPNVAIHPWTGAAVDGLYFSTEVLPRGTTWQLIIETEDWRDQNFGKPDEAARLLALALEQWAAGRCWLGRSPARLEGLEIYRLDASSARHWPDAGRDEAGNLKWLRAAGAAEGVQKGITLSTLTEGIAKKRVTDWKLYTGTLTLGGADEEQNEYGLDTLSTLAKEFPADPAKWSDWRTDSTQINGKSVAADIDLDSAPAWTQKADGSVEFMIPGSAIRGSLRSVISAHWRRSGHDVWAPNGLEKEPESFDDDALLPLFGSITHDSNLLISDAYPVGKNSPQIYVQELHAEDEFTQGPYGSSKFNRPCLVSGTFKFTIAIREAVTDAGSGLRDDAAAAANEVLAAVTLLGGARMIPFGGGIWRGHGWAQLALEEIQEQDLSPRVQNRDQLAAEAV